MIYFKCANCAYLINKEAMLSFAQNFGCSRCGAPFEKFQKIEGKTLDGGQSYGYPDSEDLAALAEKLNTNVWEDGAKALASALGQSGYARVTWIGEDGLEVATGGWSGNEEIISEAMKTWWWLLYWESTHSGGMHRFQKD